MGLRITALVLAGLLAGLATARADAVTRGKYLFDAAGCVGCHTDKKNQGPLLAGGRALATPFGVFYGPNITPDPDHGIGRWSDEDFLRALRQGVAPDGSHYFPVFPYSAYTGISDQDILDIKAYIFSLPPSPTPNKPHQAKAPFGWRFLIGFWKLLYFDPGPMPPETGRGKYLVRALGHCGECHTPRNFLGGLETDKDLAGARQGPDGGAVPNITPDRATGLGKWSAGDYESLLTLGMLPDGDFVGSGMGEVVENTTGRLSKSDLAAMIAYLRAIPPVHHAVQSQKKEGNAAGNW